MPFIPYEKIKEEQRRDPEFVCEYEALAEEFQIAETLVRARMAAGLTQKDVAERMGTTQSAVARMESGKSVSLRSIRKFARSTGTAITLTFR
jgi:ribosome-binding protein aMBF1 (putative translation factor)